MENLKDIFMVAEVILVAVGLVVAIRSILKNDHLTASIANFCTAALFLINAIIKLVEKDTDGVVFFFVISAFNLISGVSYYIRFRKEKKTENE